jgi:hypothetical protein
LFVVLINLLGTGIFNADGPLDDDTVQISAFFLADTPGSVNISYTASMATASQAMGNVSGTVPISIVDSQVLYLL